MLLEILKKYFTKIKVKQSDKMPKGMDLMQKAQLIEKIDKLEARIAGRGKSTSTQKTSRRRLTNNHLSNNQHQLIQEKINDINRIILMNCPSNNN